jgi:hypothetical protein
MYAKVGAIVVAAAIAAAIAVGFAGGASASSQRSKAVTHHSKLTAHLETNPTSRDVGSGSPDSRDVGFTG